MPTGWLSQAFISTSNLLRVACNVFSPTSSCPKKAFGVIYFPCKWPGGAINGFLFVSREVESAYNRILFGGPIAGKAFNGFLFVSHEVDSAYNRILFGGHAPQGTPLLLSMGGPFLLVAPIYIMYRGGGEKVVRFFCWVCLSVTNKGLHLRCIKQKRDDSNNQIPSDDELHSPQSCEKYHAFTATTAPWLPIDFQFAMP